MNIKVKIKRQDGPGQQPYWQTFNLELEKKDTVAGILDQLNYRDDLVDETGRPCRRIRWECSCMQKMCGACAMVINGRPALACNTFVEPGRKPVKLTIEPLRKFPVRSDLIVDRSIIMDNLRDAQVFIGQAAPSDSREFEYQYETAKCLKCGLCLEVCPNYKGSDHRDSDHRGRPAFYGAVMANESYLMHTSSQNRQDELKKEYIRHFANGCSKSLACRDICPMKIQTLASMGYMNR